MIIIEHEGSTTIYLNPAAIAMVKEDSDNGKVQITTTFGSMIPLSMDRAKVFLEQFKHMIDPDVIAAELAELKVSSDYAHFKDCDPTLLKRAYETLCVDIAEEEVSPADILKKLGEDSDE